METASWEPDESHWRVTTDGIDGIDGIDDFGGKVIHTTVWDDDYDLTGKRAAIIGTGATAVQLIPEVAKVVSALTVYQRTPIWVSPKPDYAVPRRLRTAFAAVPLAQRAVRLVGSAVLTPDYSFGCKRPTFSNDYFPTFTRPTCGWRRPASSGSTGPAFSARPATAPRSTCCCWPPASTCGTPTSPPSRSPAGAAATSAGGGDEFLDRMTTKIGNTVFSLGQCATANSYYFNQHGEATLLRPTSTVTTAPRGGPLPAGGLHVRVGAGTRWPRR